MNISPVQVEANEMKGPVTEQNIQMTLSSQKSTEELVREYFKDNPELVAVAWCESRFRQVDKNGEIHRGLVNSDDIGVMQINLMYHAEEALKHELNLYTLEGNMAYAKVLFDKQGLQPWSASKPCWEKYLHQTTPIAFVERNL
jgi:hypothetical protein